MKIVNAKKIEFGNVEFLDICDPTLKIAAGQQTHGLDSRLIKDSYDYDFTTWQSVFGLKNVLDTFSMLANGNF